MFVPPLSAWRNPLAYPAGRVFGFDPTHPASKGCVFSGAVLINGLATIGGSPYNLLNVSGLSTRGGSPTVVFDGIIGPSVQPLTSNTNGLSGYNWAISPGSSTTFIAAAVFRPYTFAGGSNAHMIETATGSAAAQGLLAVTGTGGLSVHCGASAIATGLTMTANVPYFAACSGVASGTGNVVLLNLLTGQLATASITLVAMTTPDHVALGYNSGPSNGGFGGTISHIMYGNGLLSSTMLRDWAYDFWLFWYPLRPIPFGVGVTAVAPARKSAILLATGM